MLGCHVTRVTTDTLISAAPCVIFSVRPEIRINDQLVSVYHGQDILTGTLIDEIHGTKSSPAVVEYGPGAVLNNGLFIHIGTAGDAATVCWVDLGEMELP
jgi:hypothetical protein